MPTFHHFLDAAGEHRFHLKADNGEIILASEGYTTKDNARNGVAAVRTECTNDARYVRKQSPAGWSFSLEGRNGEVVGTSEVYNSHQACDAGIESVKRNAPIATEMI